jgi:hypothetical protein
MFNDDYLYQFVRVGQSFSVCHYDYIVFAQLLASLSLILSIWTRRCSKHRLPGPHRVKQQWKANIILSFPCRRLLESSHNSAFRTCWLAGWLAGWPSRDHSTWDILDLDSMDSCRGLIPLLGQISLAGLTTTPIHPSSERNANMCVHGSVRRVYPPEKRLGRKPATDSQQRSRTRGKEPGLHLRNRRTGAFFEGRSIATIGGLDKGTRPCYIWPVEFLSFVLDQNRRRCQRCPIYL